MKTTSTALALILAASGAAQAQDTTYLSYGFGYTNADIGGTLETFLVDGTVEYSINQIYLMADLDFTSFNGGGGSDELFGIKLRAGYEFAPGTLAYVGVGTFDFSGSDTITYEAGAQYDFGAGRAGIQYVAFDSDIEDATIAFDYEVSPGTRVGLAHTESLTGNLGATMLFGSYDDGPLAIDASFETYSTGDLSVGRVAAAYEFGGQFRALGALSLIDFSGTDATRVSIGAGYEVADNMWLDATYASLSSGGGSDQETIGLALTFETGDRGLVVDQAQSIRSKQFSEIGGMFVLIGEAAEFGTIAF